MQQDAEGAVRETGPDMAEAGGGRLPVSVFLIARDEAARLPRTLAALGWADQVVVVDSGSTDATPEIVRAAGAELHHRDWTGYGPQKAFAETLCRHDWMLNVDADEVVTPELAAEIARLFAAGPPPPGAYRVPILNVYPGESRPRWLARDYCVVRFYHRAAGRYRDHPLFDRVVLADGVRPGRLAAALAGARLLRRPVLSPRGGALPRSSAVRPGRSGRRRAARPARRRALAPSADLLGAFRRQGKPLHQLSGGRGGAAPALAPAHAPAGGDAARLSQILPAARPSHRRLEGVRVFPDRGLLADLAHRQAAGACRIAGSAKMTVR